MHETKVGAASSSAVALHAALLSFFRAPGQHQLHRREPAELFDAISEILRLAAGSDPALSAVREAANYFVRIALLHHDADHYALFGLGAQATPAELKERYRLLARLVHPDREASASVPWPVNAAARMNRAYEVLSSPVLRQAYDEQRAPAPALAVRRFQPPVRARMPAVVGGLRPSWVIAAGVVLGIAMLLPDSSDGQQLVQLPGRPVEVLPTQASQLRLSQQLAAPAPNPATWRR